MTSATEHSGVVASFDAEAGLGSVLDTATGRSYRFHCAQIADGSRVIAEGAPVRFRLAAGSGGAWEARQVAAALVPSAAVCPVCGAPIDGVARNYEICPTCGWEDDPAQFDDPAYAGGANPTSLNDARVSWIRASRS